MAVAGWQFVWRRALWCICERGRGLHTPPHQRSCPDILCRIKAGNYRSVFPEGRCLCEKLMTRVKADDSPVWYVSRRRGFMRGFLRMGCRAQYRQKRFCQLRCICSSCSAVSAIPRKVCRAGTPQFFRLPLCRFKPRFCALTYFDALFSEAFVLHGAALQVPERCEQPCCPLPPPWQADTVFRLRRRRQSIP